MYGPANISGTSSHGETSNMRVGGRERERERERERGREKEKWAVNILTHRHNYLIGKSIGF